MAVEAAASSGAGGGERGEGTGERGLAALVEGGAVAGGEQQLWLLTSGVDTALEAALIVLLAPRLRRPNSLPHRLCASAAAAGPAGMRTCALPPLCAELVRRGGRSRRPRGPLGRACGGEVLLLLLLILPKQDSSVDGCGGGGGDGEEDEGRRK